jgi:hypothetical protein
VINAQNTLEMTALSTPHLCSAVLITRNESAVLAATLAALHFVDEIVVVDSGSTDDTCAIAQAYGARVIHQDWLGFGQQKQFAVAQAQHAWVLCVDADERISSQLQQSILQALAAPQYAVYRMSRCNHFLGRALRYGEGYPDWNTRLFRKDAAAWSDDTVHECVRTTLPIGRLEGDLLHESAVSIAQYSQKQNHYTSLQAQALFKAGKRAAPWQLFAKPIVRFIKFYLVKRGFLDGMAGFVHIIIDCYHSFLKVAKLLELELEQVAQNKTPIQ